MRSSRRISIVEAENPHNLRVGTAGFYVDPTRIRPVPRSTWSG